MLSVLYYIQKGVIIYQRYIWTPDCCLKEVLVMSERAHFEKKSEDFLCDEAYKRLEEMIVTAELKPGSIVSEMEVADHLELGRTPVREAFKRMERYPDPGGQRG